MPDGWKHELIPFPLDFAPSLPHRGVEEIRFASGFFDPAADGYWSYTFAWRLDAAAPFGADVVAGELTTYFRGLVAAVDDKHEIADRDSIAVRAVSVTRGGADLALTAHVIDPFSTKQPVELAGTARLLACPSGALWVFAIAPVRSPIRAEVAALADKAACGQPAVPNAPKASSSIGADQK